MQSGLGQPFKGQLSLVGSDNGDLTPHCIKVKFETTEGSIIAPAQVTVLQSGQTRSLLLLSKQSIPEPVVKVVVDIVCDTQMHREFLILLDPPQFLTSQEKPSSILLPQAGAQTTVPGLSAGSQPQTEGAKKLKRSKAPSGDIPDKNPIAIAPALQKNEVRTLAHSKAKSKKTSTVSQDLLKLSDESFQPQQGLKLSNTLSSSAELKLVENMVELRAAQVRMAAILRDEEPTQADTLERSVAREKLQALQIETAQLKQQSLKNKRDLEELKGNSYSRNWIVGLSALALLGLMAALMLLVYLRKIQKAKDVSWWELAREAKDVDKRKSLEEIVDNLQASYEPNLNTSPASFDSENFENLPSPESSKPGGSADNASGNEDEHFLHTGQKQQRSLTLEETNSSVFNFFAPIGNSVNVEEISDVTQEAEFWMSVNDPQRAIEILEPQSNGDHPDSPVPWLYLLDLYGIVKDQNKYDQLRERFIANFNANIPEFSVKPDGDSTVSLEDFPHLITRICSLWNGSEIIPFLQSLLVDDRDGKRSGFELPVYRDILLLISIAHELERVRAIEGMAPEVKNQFGHRAGADTNTEQASAKQDLGMIDFEVIDFPKDLAPKK